MKKHKDIRNDEIRIIGNDQPVFSEPIWRKWLIVIFCVIVGMCISFLLFCLTQNHKSSYFEEKNPSVII